MTQDKAPDITVVTVNYNHGAYLAGYIESLHASHYPIKEIIVVDNRSSDDSLSVLSRYPDVAVIANPENIGYSAALNQAFLQASSELICATGPDVEVEPDWLYPLVDQYQRDPQNIFAVASRVMTLDRREIQSAGGSLHFSGHLCVFDMWTPVDSHTVSNAPREVGAIDSTSMLVDRKKFLQIGGCDTDFFVYHEEFDYCYRARMRGWKCWYHPCSRVYHGEGSREYSVRSGGTYPRMRPFLHTRNRLLSILKNYQVRTLLIILPALIVLEALNYFILVRIGLHKAYGDALRWLWQERKTIMLKRDTIQPNRLLHDGQLLNADSLTITPLLLHSTRLRIAKHLLDVTLSVYWFVMRRIAYLDFYSARSSMH